MGLGEDLAGRRQEQRRYCAGGRGEVPDEQEDVLEHFLAALGVPDHSSDEREQRAGVVADQRLEIDVSYRDDIYDVTMRESSRGGAPREVALRDLRACR